MKTTTLLSTTALVAFTSMLSAQFSPMPSSPFFVNSGDATQTDYANLINNEGWLTQDTSGWDAPPAAPVADTDFDPNGFMNVFIIGESALWHNAFGIHYDTVSEQYSNSMSTFAQNATIFEGINTPAPFDAGYYTTVPLGGSTAFDLWISTDAAQDNGRGGIWSMFNPEYNNPDNDSFAQGKGNVVTVDGKIYHLYVFEDINTDANSDYDYNDVIIGVQFFREDGTPFGPVPEPSFYGAMGALGLVLLIARRRMKSKLA